MYSVESCVLSLENHTETSVPCLREPRQCSQKDGQIWGLSCASFSANETKNISTLTEEEGMHQHISLDQNMLFQETSVNKTLDAWVELGDGHAPSWGVAEACPFQGSPPRGPGLEGEEGLERAPWATSGLQGQVPGTKSFLTAIATSPSYSEASSAQLFQTHTSQERTQIS